MENPRERDKPFYSKKAAANPMIGKIVRPWTFPRVRGPELSPRPVVLLLVLVLVMGLVLLVWVMVEVFEAVTVSMTGGGALVEDSLLVGGTTTTELEGIPIPVPFPVPVPFTVPVPFPVPIPVPVPVPVTVLVPVPVTLPPLPPEPLQLAAPVESRKHVSPVGQQ